MLENEFIVPKLVLYEWDKEIFKVFLKDSSINQPFQEADISDTSGKQATLSNYKLGVFYTLFFFTYLSSHLFLQTQGPWSLNIESGFITDHVPVPFINITTSIIPNSYWTLSFLFISEYWPRNGYLLPYPSRWSLRIVVDEETVTPASFKVLVISLHFDWLEIRIPFN